MESFRVIAPTRADLAGGTLDLWPLYCPLGGGKTINVALDLHASATFEILPAVVFKIGIEAFGQSCAFEEPLDDNAIRALPAAVQFSASVASHFLRQVPSLPEQFIRLRLETEAPLKSGLGGSSALGVALARGFGKLFQRFVAQGWQWECLHWIKDAEAAFLNTPTGTQDYLAALFGGLKGYHFDFGKIEPISYPEHVAKGLSDRLLVLFSGEQHHSGQSNWQIFKRAMEGDKDVWTGLQRIRQVSDRLHEALKQPKTDWRSVGECLNEEWKVRRSVFRVETKRLDEIITLLDVQGVIGRKVCGAAQGGSLIALVDPIRKPEVAAACTEAGIQVLLTKPDDEGVRVVEAPTGLWKKK